MSVYEKIMREKRNVIECVMDSLKNICRIEDSRHRSIHGFIINVSVANSAYYFVPKKPCLAKYFETDDIKPLQFSL